MKLIYRGVQYSEDDRKPRWTERVDREDIVYRGNTLKPKINPKFPWLKYVKQLFDRSQRQPVFDPITFWYERKRQFLDQCWYLGDREKLDRAWDLTLEIERTKAAKPKSTTQLKYRGVTYYR